MFRRVLTVGLALALAGVSHAQEEEGPPPEGTPSGTTLPSTPPAPLPPPTQPARPEVPPGSVLVPFLPSAPVATPTPTPPSRPKEWVRRRPNTAILGTGVALLVGGYGADVGFTYGYHHQPAGTSLVPVAGPWLQLGQHYGLAGPPVDTGSAEADARANRTIDQANHTIRGLAMSGEVLTGLMQAAGVVLIVVGAIVKQRVPTGSSHRSAANGVSSPICNGALLLRF